MVEVVSERERVARIVDPDAWHNTLPGDGCGEYWMFRRSKALAKADAILATLRASGEVREAALAEALEEALSVLERLPYGDWPGAMYSGKVAAANRLIRRARAALAPAAGGE